MSNKKFWGSQEDNSALTQNLDKAYKSTLSNVLDLFSRGGAYRTQSEDECVKLFSLALAEDKDLTMRCLFYLRDVRGGVGERRFFRVAMKYLADVRPGLVISNIPNIAEFGRWDDLFVLLRTPVEKYVIGFVKEQLGKDITSDAPSLLGKWIPSNVTSSKATVRDALHLKHLLGMSSKEYRKMVSGLRQKIKIVESQMSANQWGEIAYDHVPSKASLVYSKAFKRHDDDRYTKFIADVTDGKAKIHAGVLYPHEIVKQILDGNRDVPAANALWKNLPDYAGDQNAIVMADTSGSMHGLPISISVGLALYFAERNKNDAFKMRFLTFSVKPELQIIQGETIMEKVMNLSNADWDGNTDIRLAFKTVLDRAVEFNVPVEEMPKVIYIISDMQFDAAIPRPLVRKSRETWRKTGNIVESELDGSDVEEQELVSREPAVYGTSSYEDVKKMYESAGYTLPTVVFWNVNSLERNSPVTVKDDNTILVSGSSPIIFKFVLESESKNPVDFMVGVLGNKRYDVIAS